MVTNCRPAQLYSQAEVADVLSDHGLFRFDAGPACQLALEAAALREAFYQSGKCDCIRQLILRWGHGCPGCVLAKHQRRAVAA